MEKYQGLTEEEVKKSLEENGSNKITEQKGETILEKALNNLKDPIVTLLCIMCVVSLGLAYFGYVNIATPIGILIAILLATFVSTFSEVKSDNVFKALKASEQLMIKVYRDNQVQEINIDDIVVGDLVIIQSGDVIPADGYIYSGKIRVDQSSINGESEDALKIAVTSETDTDELVKLKDISHAHLVYRGTVVTDNEAIMKVTRVGDKTVYGEIGLAVQQDNDIETPLKLKLGKLAKQISLMGYIGALLIAIVIIGRAFLIEQVASQGTGAIIASLINAASMALSIIVMAVPEGLPLLISLVCTLNMRKMYNENVLVRVSNDIETAGSMNILFSDKTGTITQGVLKVVDVKTDDKEKIYQNMMLNNSSKMTEKGAIGSNTTDRALLNYVSYKTDDKSDNYTIEDSIKFNSTIKYSAVTVKDKNGNITTYIKGAPEIIMGLCGTEKYKDDMSEMTNKAMRVLGFAHIDGSIKNNRLPEGEITFDGLVGIRDVVRTDAKDAIQSLKQAGIQIVMVTGDCKETAVAIAKEAGLIEEDSIALTSEELAEKTDDEIKEILPKLSVVSRALPTDKQRLVKISQELGLVAGMTGDGTNDAPALKQADVGFAMGSGTEVAKGACGITILDDSLKSISKAVLYGRTIYHNIQKFLIYQLSINVSAMLICLLSPLIGLEEPLTVPQILVVNIIMDTLAAIALGAEPVLESYMKEAPKKREQNILTKYTVASIAVASVVVTYAGALLLKTNTFSHLISNPHLGTCYFTMFVIFSVFNGFNVRSENGEIFSYITKNKSFLVVMFTIVVMQIVIAEFGGDLFNCYGMTLTEWLVVTAIAFTIIPIDLLKKFAIKLFSKANA